MVIFLLVYSWFTFIYRANRVDPRFKKEPSPWLECNMWLYEGTHIILHSVEGNPSSGIFPVGQFFSACNVRSVLFFPPNVSWYHQHRHSVGHVCCSDNAGATCNSNRGGSRIFLNQGPNYRLHIQFSKFYIHSTSHSSVFRYFISSQLYLYMCFILMCIKYMIILSFFKI